jgi:TetR/AcrR family transcriptional regulator, mexCD-oprJ operon repressor
MTHMNLLWLNWLSKDKSEKPCTTSAAPHTETVTAQYSDTKASPMTSAPATKLDDERLLALLAQALVSQPRATLQELAQAVGVSKATLYRFCRTREELLDRLMSHGAQVMHRALAGASVDDGTPSDALRRVIQGLMEHRALAAFLTFYWRPDSEKDTRWATLWNEFENTLDALILRGQREGVLRIDISAPALMETLIALVTGMVDAERRGRVARAGMAGMVETLFMRGALG